MDTNQEKAIEISQNFANYVNSSSQGDEFNVAMSNQHRTLQQSFTRLCLKWLEHISKDEYRADLRNESSKDIAIKIVNDFKKNNDGFVPSDFLGYI